MGALITLINTEGVRHRSKWHRSDCQLAHTHAHTLAEPDRVKSLSQESQLNPAVRPYVLP